MQRLLLLILGWFLAFGIAATVMAQEPAAETCENNQAGIYPCHNIDLLAHVPLADMGETDGSDIWGWTDPMTGIEYALMARRDGVAVFDLSTPTQPRYVAEMPSHLNSAIQRDVKTLGNYAIVGSEASGHGMQVFDLTAVRQQVDELLILQEAAHYNGFGRSHNIVVNTDKMMVYVVGVRDADNECNNGLHAIDMSNPLQPTFAGCYDADGYVHDAQCLTYTHGPDPDYIGHDLCFTADFNAISIVDVTATDAMTRVATISYPNYGYIHQGWLTTDHHYLISNDETDELGFGHNTRTYFWDMTDLDNPQPHFTYEFDSPAIDHNLYTDDQFAYLANYTSGLRILDITNLNGRSAQEVAYFDVFPNGDPVSYGGAWSVYPYFESGILVVSGFYFQSGVGDGTYSGLFVLQPDLGVPSAVDGVQVSAETSLMNPAIALIAASLGLMTAIYTVKKPSPQ